MEGVVKPTGGTKETRSPARYTLFAALVLGDAAVWIGLVICCTGGDGLVAAETASDAVCCTQLLTLEERLQILLSEFDSLVSLLCAFKCEDSSK